MATALSSAPPWRRRGGSCDDARLPMMTGRRPWAASLSFLADAGAVALFVAAGRRTHEEAGLSGYLEALRPFLTALVIVWVAVFVWQAIAMSRAAEPSGALDWRARAASRLISLWPTGVTVWIVTAGGGLALRAAGGGGLAGGFPYVTFAVLGALLLGWRLAVALIRRRRRG